MGISAGDGLSLGMEVRVFDRSGKRYQPPTGGYPGKVTKLGTKLVSIAWSGHHKPQTFRRDTRQANDGYGFQHFLTPGEATEKARTKAATEVLRASGVTLARRDIFTLDQLEDLARLVGSFGVSYREVS